MTVRALPTIKRFLEGTANVVFAPSGDARGHRRAKDFMIHESRPDRRRPVLRTLNREAVGAMQNRVFRSIGRFFAGIGDVIGTPSGDARGHLRVYAQKTVTRGRNF